MISVGVCDETVALAVEPCKQVEDKENGLPVPENTRILGEPGMLRTVRLLLCVLKISTPRTFLISLFLSLL